MIKYRADIDGLRAFAVLAVIIYHAEFQFMGSAFLPGGYLGVDVFFVISGFLITTILLNELRASRKISIKNFYKKRIRRLLPALLIVIAVSLPFAYFILLPEQLIDYAGSLIGSLAFSSNFYWYLSLQEYGAESSQLKPFLHTWSLAVEEQYYLLYPLLLMLIGKRSVTFIAIVFLVLAAGSLVFAEVMSARDSSFSFYLLPSRLWELIAGGLCALYVSAEKKPVPASLVPQALTALSLMTLFVAIFLFDKGTKHPGVITLIPVVATMLLIALPARGNIATRLLSFKPVVFIGLLSYALYLWHYPIFAYARLSGYFATDIWKLAFIILALLASILSYNLIETPFRQKTKVSWNATWLITGGTSLAAITTATILIANDGFPGRYTNILKLTNDEMIHYRSDYWSDYSRFVPYEDPFDTDKISIEVIGNSYALDVANALSYHEDVEIHFEGMTGYRCNEFTLPLSAEAKDRASEAISCGKNRTRFTSISSGTDIVILADSVSWVSQYANEAVLMAFQDNVEAIRSNFDGPIIVIKNRPVWSDDGFRLISEYGSVDDGVNSSAQKDLTQSIDELVAEDVYYRAFFQDKGVSYLSLIPLLCPDGECKLVANSRPMFFDRNHITLDGARFISEQLSSEVLSIYRQQQVNP